MPNKTKICFNCKKKKPLTEFMKNKANKDGLAGGCLQCKRKYANAYAKKRKEEREEEAKRPQLGTMSLEDFIKRRERKQHIAQEIIILTNRIGRLSGQMRAKNLSKDKDIVNAEREQKVIERDALKEELARMQQEEPIPQSLYMPHVIEPNSTQHGFKPLKTLLTACNQRNRKIDSLTVDETDERYVQVKPTQFQVTTSQKVSNLRKRKQL